MPNLKRKLSTWSIVFFTEIMIYSVKLINHILTFLVKMRANILTIEPQKCDNVKDRKGNDGIL